MNNTRTPTEAQIDAAWSKAVADLNRLTAAQTRLPETTGEEANLTAEDLAWKRAMAALQGGAG